MIHRDDVPETPEWQLPAREDEATEPAAPPNCILGEN